MQGQGSRPKWPKVDMQFWEPLPTRRELGSTVSSPMKPMCIVLIRITPIPQIDIIGAVMIVWRVRGKTIRSVLCNIVCNSCAQCDAHTYEPTNSSLYWVLSHWAHFTVLRFIFVVCITVCCVHA